MTPLLIPANRPINFFAAVEDQRGKRVPGVKVIVNVRYSDGTVRPDYVNQSQQLALQTDGDGMIAITDQRLQSLSLVSMEKNAYEFARVGNQVFSELYSLPANAQWPKEPLAFENPVVIPGWKRGEAADLVVDGKMIYTPKEQTATVIKFDKTPVELEVDWNTPGTGEKPTDWTVVVKVKNGHLVETHDVFMYEAPSSGYQPEWRFDAAGKYRREVKAYFYFVANDGAQYGRMNVLLTPYYGESHNVSVSYWINLHGSRNLLSEKGD